MIILPVTGIDADVLLDTGASSTVVPRCMCRKYGWSILNCDSSMSPVMTKSACETR